MGSRLTERVVEQLAELLAIPAVVGYEGPLMRHLAARLEALGLTVRSGPGSVVGCGDDGGDLVLAAHADRHGLVCTGPGSFTYAAHVLPAIRGMPSAPRHAYAETICNQFGEEGVRAYDATTGQTVADGQVAHAAVCGIDDLGIKVPVDGLDGVRPATPIAFTGTLHRNGRRVTAQMDNVLGVAMALVMVEEGYQGTVVFTAEREVGGSWRYLYEQLLCQPDAPRLMLVLDTSPFTDAEAVDAGAVVLRWRDAQASFDTPTVKKLVEVAQGRNIPVVMKDRLIERLNGERRARGEAELDLGRTELGRLVRGSGGWANGATLQVPSVGYHTNTETVSTASIDNAMALLLASIAMA